MVDRIVSYIEKEPSLQKPEELVEIGKDIAKSLEPIKWQDVKSDLSLFLQLASENSEAFKTLDAVFRRRDMLEFTNFALTFYAKQAIYNIDTMSKYLLYIISRAVQETPSFYKDAIPTIYAILSVNAENRDFPKTASILNLILDFEPDAAIPAIEAPMNQAFHVLVTTLREGAAAYVTARFIGLLSFWSQIVVRFPNYVSAFDDICLYAIRNDNSLRFNPYRIQVLRILVSCKQYITPLSPLAKILEKSLMENQTDDEVEIGLIAERQVAQTKKYQEYIYSQSIALMKECLVGISKRAAFPEIVAPIDKAIADLIDNPAFEQKSEELKALHQKIRENTRWILQKRETTTKSASEDFDISKCTEFKGKAPFDKK